MLRITPGAMVAPYGVAHRRQSSLSGASGAAGSRPFSPIRMVWRLTADEDVFKCKAAFACVPVVDVDELSHPSPHCGLHTASGASPPDIHG